jgi:tRNA threonylcarbamoyladenosine biosynthesis protein TsaB
MNIVAIETATETVGVAVRTTDGVQAELTLTGCRRHVESLTPALEHLLTQVGLEVGDLEAVAVDLGPGLFTGLRVGVSSAKALAQSLELGVIGLTSTDILLRAAAEAGHRGHILAAVDARRGEVFATMRDLPQSDPGPDGGDVIPLGLFSPTELVNALERFGGVPMTAVGDGAQRYADSIGAVDGVSCVVPALAFPPPLTLLAMAVQLIEEGATPVLPGLVVPLYMRDADAKSNFAQAGQS